MSYHGKPDLKATWPHIIKAPNFKHSQKPDDLHRIAERVHHGPYLECFGRRPMAGWEVRGNEAGVHNWIDGAWRQTDVNGRCPDYRKTAMPVATKSAVEQPAQLGQIRQPIVPARLDADRTAEPKTFLTAPVVGRGTKYAGPASTHVDRETGVRTGLAALGGFHG